MKSAFVILSGLAALVAATPAPETAHPDVVARGLALVDRAEKCKECIDKCNDIGGIADAICKVFICGIQCVVVDM